MRNLVISLAAVAALCTIASPAAALQNVALAAPRDQDGGSGTAAPRSRAPADDSDRLVCLRINPGGSRITRRICRTRAEWQARGGDEVVDPR